MIQDKLISNNISYSLLKAFDDDGPKSLIRRKRLSGKGIQFGSLLDDYISLQKEEFNSKYEVLPMAPLEPMVKKVASLIRETFALEDMKKIQSDEDLKLKVVELMKLNGLYKSIKTTPTFVKKFNFNDFYKFTESCYLDKELVFISDLIEIQEARGSLFSNKRTKDYFINDYENIYQLELNFKYKKQNVKAILDMVNIDHKNKIIRGVDLKTGTPKPGEFSKNFFNYRYYMQAAIYQEALHRFNKKMFKGEYTVENFRFLYLCRTDIDNPVIYTTSQKWLDAAWKGFTTYSGYKYRGITELVDEIIWHKDNKLFEHTRKFYENSEVTVEDYYINVNK